MAVKIRLRQQGRVNHKTYRLVACDTRVKRDGGYLAKLGWYDPAMKEKNGKLDEEAILSWLDKGAEMTHEAKHLIGRIAPGVLKKWTEKREAKKVKEVGKRRERRRKKTKAA